MRRKICVVFGTRPEAIKMAPVVHALQATSCFDVKVCVTAQHRQMLDQVMDLFSMSADFDLNVMQEGASLTQVTCRVLTGMQDVLSSYKPDCVLVHGDTTTALAATLAAYYQKVPVGHVEAGLRTGDIYSPWPEEINRRVVANVAAWHFAPTKRAVENLIRESVPATSIWLTGNTVVDALLWVSEKIDTDPNLRARLAAQFAFLGSSDRVILVTGHRRESFGEGFRRICEALKKLASDPKNQIIYPVHLNPNVREPVRQFLAGLPNVHLVEPVGYAEFTYLMRNARLILTDSGGVQEEAPSFGRPVLVMRDRTERPEALEAGVATLVGTDPEKIVSVANQFLNSSQSIFSELKGKNPYGDGKAASRIVEALQSSLPG